MKALDGAPRWRPDLEVYLHCFLDVSADRSFGGSVTFTAVALWCQAFGVSVAEIWPVVRRADHEVHEWQSRHKK